MSGRRASTDAGGDPARAVRVSVGPASRLADDPPLTVVPPPEPATDQAGSRLAGLPLVDGRPTELLLRPRDAQRAILDIGGGPDAVRHRVVLGAVAIGRDGVARREVLVDGWRIEVEVEPERRAALRERAQRIGAAAAHTGPLEVRAVIPGRIVAVNIEPGEVIEAGQQLLVIEAMKMQNEVRSPHAGTVARIAMAAGDAIEVGDVLVVIESG